MRSSVGATWIFSICLTFIIMFVAYLTISLNYSRAFRVKNHIVSQIENNEGYDDNVAKDIESYLKSEGYSAYGNCENSIQVDGYDYDWVQSACINMGAPAGKCNACIYNRQVSSPSESITERKSYRVVTFFKFDLPVVGHYLNFQVSGESRYINDFSDENDYVEE